jgi:hypothetical protein
VSCGLGVGVDEAPEDGGCPVRDLRRRVVADAREHVQVTSLRREFEVPAQRALGRHHVVSIPEQYEGVYRDLRGATLQAGPRRLLTARTLRGIVLDIPPQCSAAPLAGRRVQRVAQE